MSKKLTTKQFVQRAERVHGNRYDYALSVFTGVDNKVTIICRVHGPFQQRPADHHRGSGCALCNERQALTKDVFTDRANEKHNCQYSYEKVKYKNVTTKVKIVCPEHGTFEQTPKDHMYGYGCPSCGGTKKVTTKQFIARARVAHKSKYSYKKTNLDGMNTNVTITCGVHGDFSQRPADHLNGVGCPVCGAKKQGGGYSETFFLQCPGVKKIPAQVYLVSVDNHFCKIGITKKRYIKQRFPGIHFSVLAAAPLPLYEAFLKEQQILDKFQSYRYKIKDLQKLRCTGWTECFPLSLAPILKQEIDKCVGLNNV